MSRADCYWHKYRPALSIWLMNPFSVVIGSLCGFVKSICVPQRFVITQKLVLESRLIAAVLRRLADTWCICDSSPGFSQWLLAQSQHTSRDPDLILAVIPAQMCRRWAWLLPSTFCISNKVKETHYKILHKMYPVYF